MEEEPSLKDYRTTHQLMNFLRGQMQGWFARENLLFKAEHVDSHPDHLDELSGWIDKIQKWNASITQGVAPVLPSEGSISDPELVREVCACLHLLFAQYVEMNERLNAILDHPVALSERRSDFHYIVACLAWVYYAIHHIVHGDHDFAKRFDDKELLRIREGDIELSQRELHFVNYLFHSFKDETLYTNRTVSDVIPILEKVMDETMLQQIKVIDYYLTLLSKDQNLY